MRIRRAFVIGLLLAAAAALHAQEFRTVAVFRSDDVILAFYQDSSLYRDYDRARTQYQTRLADIDSTLDDYQVRRSAAVDSGDTRTARRLREQIDDLTEERSLLQESWAATSADFLDQFAGDEFWLQLQAVVQYLAEDGGYTLVLDRSAFDLGVFWVSQSIDITQDVIQELLARYR